MNHRIAALVLVLAGVTTAHADPADPYAHVGVTPEQLSADYWIARAKDAEADLLTTDAIAKQNAAMVATDDAVDRIEDLPDRLDAKVIRGWIEGLSKVPTGPLYGDDGIELARSVFPKLTASLALDRVKDRDTAFGLVVRRANLRTFPTTLRVFRSADDKDIDRFQESALFPGTPVAIAHESADGKWLFVASDLYDAWIEADAVARGDRASVFGYANKAPSLVVTGAKVETVHTPEMPALSELVLDMGVRVPLLADWPGDRAVNGQHPYTAHVVELPIRRADGTLAFAPALIPRTADVATSYLDFDRETLLRQAFKFLGERYGWGHSYDTRDCSGFVSEVYRSMGLFLPRNTSDQAVSPALERVGFEPTTTREQRLAALKTLDVGDLVYIPGHVMMVIGHERGETFVIHQTTGITRAGPDGEPMRVSLNAVSVTPLASLLAGDGTPLVDRITAVQRFPRALKTSP